MANTYNPITPSQMGGGATGMDNLFQGYQVPANPMANVGVNQNLNPEYSAWLSSYGMQPSTENLAMFNQSNQAPQTFLGMDKGTMGNIQGIAGLAGAGWGIYNDIQQNKRANEAYGLQKDAYNYNKARSEKFHSGLAKSGLTQ